jgi:hypothetical protein
MGRRIEVVFFPTCITGDEVNQELESLLLLSFAGPGISQHPIEILDLADYASS